MLRRAERRPARDDFPPRRIRATVPAHSKPVCPVAFLTSEFGSLIEQEPSRSGAIPRPLDSPHALPIRCAEKNPNPTRPPPPSWQRYRKVRGERHREGMSCSTDQTVNPAWRTPGSAPARTPIELSLEPQPARSVWISSERSYPNLSTTPTQGDPPLARSHERGRPGTDDRCPGDRKVATPRHV
jgi:hypothetical protein